MLSFNRRVISDQPCNVPLSAASEVSNHQQESWSLIFCLNLYNNVSEVQASQILDQMVILGILDVQLATRASLIKYNVHTRMYLL